MPNREQINSSVDKMLTPTATSTGTIQSGTLDCRGFDAGYFCAHYGATAPQPTSYKVQESDDDSTYSDAPATSVIDTAGAHAVSTTRRIAYVGNKRYAQLQVVQSGSTTLTITGHLGYPSRAPTTNPV